MIIKHDDLPHCSRILKLQHGLLLDSENYDVFAPHSYLESGLRSGPEV